MSDKTTVQVNGANKYYTVKLTEVGGQQILKDYDDYQFMMSLFGYLLPGNDDPNLIGQNLTQFKHQLEVVSFCMLPMGFDTLIFCTNKAVIIGFMDDLVSLFSAYFLDKYKIQLIDKTDIKPVKPDQVLAISRTIHTSPKTWRNHPYSSLRSYLYHDDLDWVRTGHITGRFGSPAQYLSFLES